MRRLVLCIIFLVLLCKACSGQVHSIRDGAETLTWANKIHARKLMIDIFLDYDDGGPNPKHDPKKGKPGIGSKNP